MSEHVHRVRVGWGDCDPAGIVYFPRYFDFFHQAMETWFGAIGFPYSDVIVGRQVGFPAVHTEADFKRPTKFGDSLDVALRVEALGTKSITLGYSVAGPDETEPRLRGRTVCAVMDLRPDAVTFQHAIALPDDLRAAMRSFSGG